jgi:Uncharacterized protein conserved in bacteria (DUF2059)
MMLSPRTVLALAFGACLLALPAATVVRAETVGSAVVDPVMAERLAKLSVTMQIGPIIDVMQQEGVTHGETLATDMFPDGGDSRWGQVVAGIYDAQGMKDVFNARFARELAGDPEAVAAIEDFFGSERGQRILTLEVSARRALLDEAVEDAAKVAAADMAQDMDPRLALLQDFALAGDLIEMNVAGAMNANLAFYKGMAESGAFGNTMTEDQILSDVWGQEPEVRANTEEWLFPYLAMAYQPLSDEDLEAYTAFWESAAGKRLNTALFASFDVVFTDISRDLGRAAARQMQGDDI